MKRGISGGSGEEWGFGFRQRKVEGDGGRGGSDDENHSFFFLLLV